MTDDQPPPAASQDGAGMRIPLLDPPRAEEHPLLAPIIAKRAEAAGAFTPEFSGLRGQDFDRGLLCAFEAVNATLQRMSQAALHQGELQQGSGE